jgi:hypothetical protein
VLLSAAPAAADRQVVTLTDPTQPAELFLRMPYATIEVVAKERSDVAIELDFEDVSDGIGVPVVPPIVHGNRIELLHPLNNVAVNVRIEVPRRTDLYLHTSNVRLVHVVGVRGEIEVESSNGAVELEDVGGSVAVSTSNGPITARVSALDEGSTVSLLTSNGPIRLTLPASFEGRVLAETDGDPIHSEFPVVREPVAGVTRPGRVLSGRIGAGGALVRLRTDNAQIHLTRSPPR